VGSVAGLTGHAWLISICAGTGGARPQQGRARWGAATAGAGEAGVPVCGWDGVGAGRGAARARASANEAGAGAGEAGLLAARLGRGRGAERRIRWGRERA
jgi:hypothetical protein